MLPQKSLVAPRFTSISGVADHMAEDDSHALEIIRDIVKYLGKSQTSQQNWLREPLYDPEELLGCVPKDAKKAYDIK